MAAINPWVFMVVGALVAGVSLFLDFTTEQKWLFAIVGGIFFGYGLLRFLIAPKKDKARVQQVHPNRNAQHPAQRNMHPNPAYNAHARPTAPLQPHPAQMHNQQALFCRRCGNRLRIQDNFCAHCGSRLR